MRDGNNKLLRSRPISEIKIDSMERQYVTRVQWYLEQELHRRMTFLSDQRGYLIHFPEGTLEEVYPGQSTGWTYKTTIRFPNGATLTKYVTSPLSSTQRGLTMLTFPTALLEGPEPPQIRR